MLGHGGVGVIDSVGAGVTKYKPGDRVLISCISSCGRCPPWRKACIRNCRSGGWMLGHKLPGSRGKP